MGGGGGTGGDEQFTHLTRLASSSRPHAILSRIKLSGRLVCGLISSRAQCLQQHQLWAAIRGPRLAPPSRAGAARACYRSLLRRRATCLYTTRTDFLARGRNATWLDVTCL